MNLVKSVDFLPIGVDKTTTSQKAIALTGLASVGGVGLYYGLPYIVAILANLWLTAVMLIPILFIAFNYEVMRSPARPNRHKSFDHGDLFCVDADDGLWQETEER